MLAIFSVAALATAATASANTAVRIDSVPYEYAPLNSVTNREPVSISSFHFEVEPETGRARVVVDYTYPDQLTYGADDPSNGPPSSLAQLPNLTYDPAARAVIYESNGTRTVCASVTDRHGLLGHNPKIHNTGGCTVKAVPSVHTVDTGWNLRHVRALDIYLEVR